MAAVAACGGVKADSADGGGTAIDSGGSLVFIDDDAADFGAGAMENVDYADDRLQLGLDVLVGEFSSRVFDAEGEARWTSLRWRPANPYGKPLPADGESDRGYERPFDMAENVLLLHFDETGPLESGATFADASGHDNNARLTVNKGAPVRTVQIVQGVFGSALEDTLDSSLAVDGASPYLQFGSDDFTWSMWINASDPCQSSNSNDAYMGGEELATRKTHIWMGCARSSQPFCDQGDATNGRPTATICTDFGADDCVRLCGDSDLPDGGWHHLAMRKVGHPQTTVDLWFDGVQEKTGSTTLVDLVDFKGGGDLGIGHFSTPNQSDSDAQGLLDEMAIFRRALTDDELRGLFYRSVVRLRFQVRVCAEPDCDDGRPFVGPDGTDDSFYEDSTDAPAETPVSLDGLRAGRYFQYRVAFATVDNAPSPELLRVEVAAEK